MTSEFSRSPLLAPTYRNVDALQAGFARMEEPIRRRLAAFREIGRRPDRELFEEMCFCLLAIQTKARMSDAAIRGLVREGLLWKGEERAIAGYLRHRVRFHNHKAAYLVRARERFFSRKPPTLRTSLDAYPAPREARAWLVREVDGFGFKEASHFLRNVGRGEGLAILDRHVLANLVRHGVVSRPPRSITPRRYLAIEDRMRRFADAVGIPMAALDLLFWSLETGEIFK